MYIVSRGQLKGLYVETLFRINKDIYAGKDPGNVDHCIALGASLSRAERDSAHDECRKLLKESGIIFKDDRAEG